MLRQAPFRTDCERERLDSDSAALLITVAAAATQSQAGAVHGKRRCGDSLAVCSIFRSGKRSQQVGSIEHLDRHDLAIDDVDTERSTAGVKLNRFAVCRPAPPDHEPRDGVEARTPGIPAATQLDDAKSRD